MLRWVRSGNGNKFVFSCTVRSTVFTSLLNMLILLKKTLKSCNNIEDAADTSVLLKLKNVALSNPSPWLNASVSKSYKLFHFTNPRLLLVLFRRLFFLIDGKESKRRWSPFEWVFFFNSYALSFVGLVFPFVLRLSSFYTLKLAFCSSIEGVVFVPIL